MNKHLAGLDVEELMLKFVEESGSVKDVNAQQFIKGYAYMPAVEKYQPAGKWALVALRKVSFYDTMEEAHAVLQELPVQGAIYPPRGMKTEDIPQIPGFGIATFEKVSESAESKESKD